MRTLDDLRDAFAALADTAPTELTDRVDVPSRARRIGRIPLLAAAAAVAAIVVLVPWVVHHQSDRDVRPARPDPGLTQPIKAPSSLASVRTYAFYVGEVPGFASTYS
jgi:hypothetical protein